MEISKLRDAQIDRLIDLGFNERLGLSPEDYRKRFPGITPKPGGFAGRFDVFLVVEGDPAIDLGFQNRAAGVTACPRCGELTTDGSLPGGPYYIWTHDGTRYMTMSIGAARETFGEDEVPCSQLEVTSLFIHYPELFRSRGIDSGRTYGMHDYYSTLLWVQEHAELALHHRNDFTPGLGVLSRGMLEQER
jgi:hypothetical protein